MVICGVHGRNETVEDFTVPVPYCNANRGKAHKPRGCVSLYWGFPLVAIELNA